MSSYSTENDKQGQLNFNSFNSNQYDVVGGGNQPPMGLQSQLRGLGAKQLQKSLSASGVASATGSINLHSSSKSTMDSPVGLAGYNWSAGPTAGSASSSNPYAPSSATTAGGANLDLWSNLNTNPMDGGKDVSAGGVPGAGARDRNSFFQPKDNSMVYGNMFDGSTTANLTANNNLSNNDVDIQQQSVCR
ncbi:unnamed protein product [Ambrosiozyma monospora]|uniref:Unnamed protein product n=1 Tax=Ambrosiozyma monospora TaxID=43982 RepID=A0ACB5UCS2_AMBMO|nr:unnamed protein product [Ambrosiozyma monospora]